MYSSLFSSVVNNKHVIFHLFVVNVPALLASAAVVKHAF